MSFEVNPALPRFFIRQDNNTIGSFVNMGSAFLYGRSQPIDGWCIAFGN